MLRQRDDLSVATTPILGHPNGGIVAASAGRRTAAMAAGIRRACPRRSHGNVGYWLGAAAAVGTSQRSDVSCTEVQFLNEQEERHWHRIASVTFRLSEAHVAVANELTGLWLERSPHRTWCRPETAVSASAGWGQLARKLHCLGDPLRRNRGADRDAGSKPPSGRRVWVRGGAQVVAGLAQRGAVASSSDRRASLLPARP